MLTIGINISLFSKECLSECSLVLLLFLVYVLLFVSYQVILETCPLASLGGLRAGLLSVNSKNDSYKSAKEFRYSMAFSLEIVSPVLFLVYAIMRSTNCVLYLESIYLIGTESLKIKNLLILEVYYSTLFY